MDRTHGFGESPPQQGLARAGDAEISPMVRSRGRQVRWTMLLGILGLLLIVTAIAPDPASARPRDSEPSSGEPYGTGDPTGDDQPSPTPKPNSLKSGSITRGATSDAGLRQWDRRGFLGSPLRWSELLRIISRLSVR